MSEQQILRICHELGSKSDRRYEMRRNECINRFYLLTVVRISIVKSNVAISFYMNETIDWEKVIKKEARGLDDYDLGEVQEVNEDIVITKKGVVDKDRFYLPRNKVNKFDGDKLWFEVSKDEAHAYKHSETIDWEKVIKKEARGLDDYDLGEVQEVNEDIVITKKGVVDKDRFYLPRSKALRFEEDKLWFEVSKDEAKAYKHD
jgi:hypothetical protein